jgi:hypothetical protein
MKLADVQIPDGNLRFPHISLVKLCGGKTIADIEVSLSREFGDVSVKLVNIVFTDGSQLGCEGEHDHPYVTDYSHEALPSNEILSALYKEENS